MITDIKIVPVLLLFNAVMCVCVSFVLKNKAQQMTSFVRLSNIVIPYTQKHMKISYSGLGPLDL